MMQPLRMIKESKNKGKIADRPFFALNRSKLPTTSQLMAYVTSCEQVHLNIPPMGNFWRFYDVHKIQVNYLIQELYHWKSAKQGKMPLALFEEIWRANFFFRPVLATMVSHGDLEFYNADMFCVLFGNLPAYTLTFMLRFLNQLNKSLPADPKYVPRTYANPIRLDTSSATQHEMARRSNYTPFLDHTRDVINMVAAKIKSHAFQDFDIFRKCYPGIDIPQLTHHIHFLMVFREALRIRDLYRSGSIPRLYSARQLKCLPYSFMETDTHTEINHAIRLRSLFHPLPLDEREEAKKSWSDLPEDDQ